jgi:hypothetical protein
VTFFPPMPDALMLGRWARSVTVLLVSALSLSGCAYQTSFVRMPTAPTVSAPAGGELVAVRAEDHRKGVSGYEVGFKRNLAFGYEFSTIDLGDKALLSDGLVREVVAVLRERGYRAHDARDQPPDQADRVLVVGIEKFSINAVLGNTVVPASAVLTLRAVFRSSDRPSWNDTVLAEVSKKTSLLAGQTDSDYQEILDDLWSEVRRQLRAKVPPACLW